MTLKIEDIAHMDLGTLDIVRLRRTMESDLTIIAPLGTPAAEVADLCDKLPAGGVVVVLSPEQEPVGILDPRHVVAWLQPDAPGTFKLRELVPAIEKVTAKQVRSTLQGRVAVYVSRPPEYYCERGQHYADGNPCSRHE